MEKSLSLRAALFAFGILSALALAVVYTAQFRFGLAPCHLCLYQRMPHMAVIALAVLGIGLSGRVKSLWFLIGISLAYAADTVIAAYHSGVERKWWPSFLEGCTIPEIKGSAEDMLAQIQAAPVVRCDEIPWVDPVLGLSMANYNAIICLVLAVLALWRALPARPSRDLGRV